MTVFADSSALVKLYAAEPGSQELAGLGAATISTLARVEVPSALWRKERAGEVDVASVATLLLAFEHDVRGSADESPRFTVIGLGEPLVEAAAKLCATDRLRAYDAVQLATLLALSATTEVQAFACFDDQLRDAAGRRGVALLP